MRDFLVNLENPYRNIGILSKHVNIFYRIMFFTPLQYNIYLVRWLVFARNRMEIIKVLKIGNLKTVIKVRWSVNINNTLLISDSYSNSRILLRIWSKIWFKIIPVESS